MQSEGEVTLEAVRSRLAAKHVGHELQRLDESVQVWPHSCCIVPHTPNDQTEVPS